MAPSLLTLPVRAARIGGRLAKRLALPVLAVTAVRKVMQRSSSADRVTPEPSVPFTSNLRPVSDPAHEPTPVVDPVPLAEAAVDLDVEVLLASELPIRSYDALAEADAEHAIRELTDPEEVRTVLQFEEENAKRSAVLTAARAHLDALAVQA